MNQPIYNPKFVSRSDFIDIRGFRYHVRKWGSEDAPIIFLCHGWMDASASFQFLIDELLATSSVSDSSSAAEKAHTAQTPKTNWQIIAPDWRGFGLSENNHSDTYYFPDYFADLELIMDHYLVGGHAAPVHLVGHSMGGNIVAAYAGIRPQRIQTLINIEGFGLPPSKPTDAPEHYAGWFDRIKKGHRLKSYADFSELAKRLSLQNKSLSADQAAFLAQHWGAEAADGKVYLNADPAHKNRNPVLYREAEMQACWQSITAPTLTVIGEDSEYNKWVATETVQSRMTLFPNNQIKTIKNAGHMLHFDQPQKLAATINAFINDSQS